ncbi:MAG: carboxypeptidase regulatory-like domain-containing protein [Planctomycetota bacterium]
MRRALPFLAGLIVLGLAVWWMSGSEAPSSPQGGPAAAPAPLDAPPPELPGRPAPVEREQTPSVPSSEQAVDTAPLPEPTPPAPGPRLTGRVVLGDGTPLPDVTVSVVSSPFATRTDGEGRFELVDLPAGEHRLRVAERLRLPIRDSDRFATGHSPFDVVVEAALLRIYGERRGASVDLVRVRALRLRADSTAEALGTVGESTDAQASLDVLLPADTSYLLQGADGQGLLAGLVTVPPAGGRFSVTLRDALPGMGALRVVLGFPPSALEGGEVRIALHQVDTGDRRLGRFRAAAETRWVGLVPGTYDVTVALVPPALDLNATTALAPVTAQVELVPDGETLLALESVAGGHLDVRLPADFQGLPIAPGPNAPCMIDVRQEPDSEPLPLEWVDAHRAGVNRWATAGPVPAGRWTVTIRTAHVALLRATTVVESGATALVGD